MPITVYRKSLRHPVSPVVVPEPTLIGKTVFFEQADGLRLAGRVERKAEGSGYVVALAIPNEAGILLISDGVTTVEASKMEVFAGVAEDAKIKHFDAISELSQEEIKSIEVKEGAVVVDYRDVRIAGFASTFQGTTAADRDGDYVVDGAFTDTITDFMKNPVMLCDHVNSVHQIAGSFTKVSQTKKGLAIEGLISNCPEMINVRFRVVEKHLRALSMGGIFYFGEDGRAIQRVILFENSLVAIPANPDALFQVRSISIDDVTKAYKYLTRNRRLTFKKL